jgi:hypothetical protein
MPAHAEAGLLFVLFLIVFFILGQIAIFGYFALFLIFFVVVIVQIFRNHIQMDGMDLRNFQFRFAFGATQNFAFFDLVFIDVDLSGTFRAADHGSILRTSQPRGAAAKTVRAPPSSVLYTGLKSTPAGRAHRIGQPGKRGYQLNKCALHENIQTGRLWE